MGPSGPAFDAEPRVEGKEEEYYRFSKSGWKIIDIALPQPALSSVRGNIEGKRNWTHFYVWKVHDIKLIALKIRSLPLAYYGLRYRRRNARLIQVNFAQEMLFVPRSEPTSLDAGKGRQEDGG